MFLSCPICDPAGIRTQDHYIKSVMLYQLSYGIKVLLNFTLNVSVLKWCKYKDVIHILQLNIAYNRYKADF